LNILGQVLAPLRKNNSCYKTEQTYPGHIPIRKRGGNSGRPKIFRLCQPAQGRNGENQLVKFAHQKQRYYSFCA